MSWIVLICSGVLEAVWATALGRSENFSRLAPSIVFLVALTLSMAGLAYAMRELPVGTSYAVWVGIGATITVVYAMAHRRRDRRAVEGALSRRDCRLCHRPEGHVIWG